MGEYDETLQEVKATILTIPQGSVALTQTDWAAQLNCTLECYNVTTKEEDEDPRNIDIPEIEG